METERPMMRKTESGEQEPVWYPDGAVQLKATETIIRLANELSAEDRGKEVQTLNIRFEGLDKVDDWSNVEANVDKRSDELI